MLTQSGRIACKDWLADLQTKPAQLKQKLRVTCGQEKVNYMWSTSTKCTARGHRTFLGQNGERSQFYQLLREGMPSLILGFYFNACSGSFEF